LLYVSVGKNAVDLEIGFESFAPGKALSIWMKSELFIISPDEFSLPWAYFSRARLDASSDDVGMK